MYLKSLTLRGFKSFADKTTMVFDPGLTVVVGPNGSGKSNISDAVLWVLGEQSAKSLRGSAMEDVIFSGSSARQSVNVAEATLVLDNSDGKLPVDLAEVAVTRRMYRSGESEYLINGTACRLMDVTDILHDSGLGREMHSIISQGNLDSILSSRPEERRELIEEAAGISKHRRRKARSERKLKRMNENLTRAKDINREINRQLRPLERQVDKARQSRELQEAANRIRLSLAVDDLRRLQGEHQRFEAALNEAEAAVSLAQLRLTEKSGELERYQALLEEKGIFVGDLGEQRQRLRELGSAADASMRLLDEKERNMSVRLSRLEEDVRRTRQERDQASQELLGVRDNLAEARATWDALKATVDELEPALREARGKRKDTGRRLAQAQADARSAQRRADQETLAYAKLSDQAEHAKVEDDLFASRLAEITKQIETCEARIAERGERKESLARELKAAREEASEAREKIRQLQDGLNAARKEEREARERVERQRGSLSALESADEQVERTSPVVAKLLADESRAKRVDCRLADLIEAPKELEGVVERLLGQDLSALVVAATDDAVLLADSALELKKTSGRLSLIRRSAVAGPSVADAPGEALLDKLTVRDGAQTALAALLGDVRLVKDTSEALSAHDACPTCTYVTPEGVVALPDGRLVVSRGDSAEQGSLERKRRIRTLREGMPVLREALEDATAAVAAKETGLAEARDKNAQARGDVARLEGEISSITSELGRLEGQKDSSVAERKRVEAQRVEARSKASDAREAIERHRSAAREAEEQVAEFNALSDRLLTERNEASAAEGDAARKVADARLKLATVQERKNNLIVRQDDLTRRLSRLEGTDSRAEADIADLKVKLRRFGPLRSMFTLVRDRVQTLTARVEDRASLAEADSASLKETIGEARSAVDEARNTLELARTRAQDAALGKSRVEVQVENAVAAIEAHTSDLPAALELPEPEDREADEAELESLERRLKAIGPVNEVAMEEYTRLKTRADYIGEQVADLESASKSLAKIAAAIDRKMRRQFLVVFDQVNANFSEVFSLLFPGGSAHLEMTDPDHPSDTGIEIVAQPRGKKIQKMMLMSGGEKSLTALALLFAVYKTRTVPFYIFDEVEAALDDSNLGKLLGAIEELRQSTQLIVISHQRRTMEQADVLYGVSMQADGVSHVVSQRLDHTGKIVEA